MKVVHADFRLLGRKVVDKVTGFEGVGVSIAFDLYGCVQLLVRAPVGPDGKLDNNEAYWFDTNRLEVTRQKPVMDLPWFAGGDLADDHGGGDLPVPRGH